MKSHGFYKDIVDKDKINKIQLDCLNFINQKCNKDENYFNHISHKIKNLDVLINPIIYKKISELLKYSSPELVATELHVQKPYCEGIPYHQDNFYHQVNPLESLKILIPLQNMNSDQGSLSFIDCENDIKVFKHIPSKVKNFSSYIPSNILKDINLRHISYTYEVGDLSYHFVNSIHFSKGNKTNKDFLFIVFRYQIPNQIINEELKNKYEKCYAEHKKIIN
tara:strand:- start:578 stop:1243 length:666 start_codon:yes stop_codon:yes gene_type:complete